MLNWLKGRSPESEKASELYGALVAAARMPYFFQAGGVPDTPEGRLEMIIVHLFLVLERLRAAGPDTEEVSRSLIETFISDVDGSLREMGVGDMSVPKKVKSAAAIFYGRSDAYRQALSASPGDKLEKVLAAHVTTAAGGSPEAAARLAHYMRRGAKHLADRDILSGGLQRLFPEPDSA